MKFTIAFLLFANFIIAQSEVSTKVSNPFNSDNRDRLDSIAKKLNYKGGDEIKVLTVFTIDENGDVGDVMARSVHPIFEEEAKRIINDLPKMTPAEFDGKRVSRKYSLPIVFRVETEKEKEKRLKKEKKAAEKLKS